MAVELRFFSPDGREVGGFFVCLWGRGSIYCCKSVENKNVYVSQTNSCIHQQNLHSYALITTKSSFISYLFC